MHSLSQKKHLDAFVHPCGEYTPPTHTLGSESELWITNSRSEFADFLFCVGLSSELNVAWHRWVHWAIPRTVSQSMARLPCASLSCGLRLTIMPSLFSADHGRLQVGCCTVIAKLCVLLFAEHSFPQVCELQRNLDEHCKNQGGCCQIGVAQ